MKMTRKHSEWLKGSWDKGMSFERLKMELDVNFNPCFGIQIIIISITNGSFRAC